MTIQQRRRRRLAVIGLVLLVLGGALGGLYIHRQHKAEADAQAHRTAGMAAAQEKNYAVVVDELGAYLRRHMDDAEALYEYAMARKHLRAPRNRHLSEAIGILQRVIDLAPEHDEARTELLELYSSSGYNHETIDLAQSILDEHPDRATAWRAKAIGLARMRNTPAATEAVKRCLELKPLDLRAAVLLLDLRQQQGADAAELVEIAKTHRQKHPDSPIADLLEAYANRLAGNTGASAQLLRAAARNPALDDSGLIMLVMLLDEARLAEDSMSVLKAASQSTTSNVIRVELARRLWEANQYQELDQRLNTVDPTRRDSDDVVLGLRAASLFELGRRDEAQAIRSALAARGADSVGGAWAAVLAAAYQSHPNQARVLITACTDALTSDPGNAYFAYLQGAAWWSLGETDLALASWKNAIKLRPGWIAPRIGYVHALLTAGRTDLAQREARFAIERAPHRIDAIAAWVVAHAATLTADDIERAQQLLPAAAAVQRAAPYEPRTLPLYIALQAQCGKIDVAAQRLQQVLKQAPALDESTWLQLAAVSRKHNLKLEGACYEMIEKSAGTTPGLALARAIDLARAGKAEEGKQMLLKAAAAPAQQHALAWQTAVGKYLDRVDDPGSLAHWTTLADTHESDARVQGWAIQARAVQQDPATRDRLIERLRALSGPQAVTWRLARAQSLLAVDGGLGAAEAAGLLQGVLAEAPNSLDAKVMLARSLEMLDLDSKAAAQIAAAARDQPQSIELAMEAARLLQAQHDYTGARVHLMRVAQRKDLDRQVSARLAAMLARQGDDVAAINVLDALSRNEALSEYQLLLLGTLCRRQGDTDRVAKVVERLLQSPTKAGVAFAADYLASTGDVSKARAMLDDVKSLPLSDSDRAILLADFEQRHGSIETAIAAWKTAVASDPANATSHRNLIAHHLRAGQTPHAIAAVEAAHQAMPADDDLGDLWRRRKLIEWAASKAILKPLLVAMIENEAAQDAIGDAMEIVKELRPQTRDESLAQLRSLAEKHLSEVQLTIVTIQLHVMNGRAGDALTLAGAAMAANPLSWEAAWIRGEALASARRWDEALTVAREWRRRSPSRTMPADVLIARALVQLNRPAEAAKQLEPHLPLATQHADRNGELLQAYAMAMLISGRVDDAVKIAAPQWGKASDWRLWALDLALHKNVTSSSAIDWLDRLATALPANQISEQTRLAAVWLELSNRHQSIACRQRARQMLDTLIKAPDAPGQQWFLLGMLCEQEENRTGAEAAYRQALKLSPDMAAASNNLAMLLAADDEHLDEALALAASAARSSPPSPGYLDTLAHVQHRLRRDEEAVATARRAIELQPDNPQWRTRLRTLLASRDSTAVSP